MATRKKPKPIKTMSQAEKDRVEAQNEQVATEIVKEEIKTTPVVEVSTEAPINAPINPYEGMVPQQHHAQQAERKFVQQMWVDVKDITLDCFAISKPISYWVTPIPSADHNALTLFTKTAVIINHVQEALKSHKRYKLVNSRPLVHNKSAGFAIDLIATPEVRQEVVAQNVQGKPEDSDIWQQLRNLKINIFSMDVYIWDRYLPIATNKKDTLMLFCAIPMGGELLSQQLPRKFKIVTTINYTHGGRRGVLIEVGVK